LRGQDLHLHLEVMSRSFVDTLDAKPEAEAEAFSQQNATLAQLEESGLDAEMLQVVDLIGGGGWTRTNDLRIMRTKRDSDRSRTFSTLLAFSIPYKQSDLSGVALT
jgi:hypothetical protein